MSCVRWKSAKHELRCYLTYVKNRAILAFSWWLSTIQQTPPRVWLSLDSSWVGRLVGTNYSKELILQIGHCGNGIMDALGKASRVCWIVSAGDDALMSCDLPMKAVEITSSGSAASCYKMRSQCYRMWEVSRPHSNYE